VDFDPRQVVADSRYALSVSVREGEAPVRHLGVLGLNAAAMNPKDVVTAGLSNINLATAGHLAAHKGATTTFEPLLSSSDQAELMPVSRFLALQDPATLFDGFHPSVSATRWPHASAAMSVRRFPAACRRARPCPRGRPVDHSLKPLELIVVADSDVLSDYLWVRAQELAGQRIAEPFATTATSWPMPWITWRAAMT